MSWGHLGVYRGFWRWQRLTGMATTEMPSATSCTRFRWPVPVVVAGAAWCLNQMFPLMSPLIVALTVGTIVANTVLARTSPVSGSASAAKFMLRLGVALLGFRLAASDIMQLGYFGMLLVIFTVAATFYTTQFAGRRMGLQPELVSLIASGFAVCGAAAIAAIQDSVRAKENLVGVALALITIHGTLMLAVIPLLGGMLGLDDRLLALWAGASVHEVAQVAAAAALIGPGALAVAMGIKLGRVLMLAPVHRAVAHLHHSGPGSLLHEIPWFLIAFVVAVVIRATGLLPSVVLDVASHASSILLAAGMFGLGLGIVLKELWPIPVRAVALSGVATLTVTAVPLLMLLIS
jgi:uncharacterized integral membrane protein (TIGR00698 family)